MAVLRRAQVALRRGPYLTLPGSQPVRISDLVVPLRYDILVRKSFFDWLATSPVCQQLLEERAFEHEYFIWYRDVLCPRYSPDVLRNSELLRHQFTDRVRACVSLLRSVSLRGFDASFKILLHSGLRQLPTLTGKRVERDFYAGDGCHRIALLMSMGYDVLEPSWYEYRLYPRFRPLDNTGGLIRATGMDEVTYATFLAEGYNLPACEELDALIVECEMKWPQRLEELRSVVATDRTAFSGDDMLDA